MRKVLTLALKDLRLLWRDRFGMFWVLVFPLMMALFFGAIFSGGSSPRTAMRIVAVDQDQSEYSRLFITRLDSSEALSVIQRHADSARSLVRQGKAVAYVVLKEGFGNVEHMFSDRPVSLVIGIDPSRKAEGGYLQGLLMEAWFSLIQERFFNPTTAQGQIAELLNGVRLDTSISQGQQTVLTDFLTSLHGFLTEVDTGALSEPSGTVGNPMSGPTIELEDVTISRARPSSSWEITFPQSLLWALIGCTAAFAVSIVSERTRGTLLRLRLAPLSRGQILAGKGLACFIFCISVCCLLLLIAKFIFGVRTPNPTLLILSVFSAGICFVGLMMLISVLGKTEQAVGGAGWAILLVMSMSGGGMVPLMFMPKWMLTISHLSPVKWGILSLEGAIWRGFSFAEMTLPLGILISVGIVAFSAGVVIFRRMGT